MIITWYGLSCFKIISGGLTVFTDPYSKNHGLTPPRGKADIITVSHSHDTHSNIAPFNTEPFIVSNPGEYDFDSIYIKGIRTYHDSEKGKTYGPNTVYNIEIENIKICHLGDLGHVLSDKQLSKLGEVDVLMVPVGGKTTITASEAVQTINQIEPKIVIPMHFKIDKLKLDLKPQDIFFKEMAIDKPKVLDKLTIKKKDLTKDTTKVESLRPIG